MRQLPSASEPELNVSVVVPVHNEVESLPELIRQLHAALGPTRLSYELILVDDGSNDGSSELVARAAESDPSLVSICLRRNFGQTAALQAGIDVSRGDTVVMLDADLQNDPVDIPRMLAKLDEGWDLVAGWRERRRDPWLNRRLPSTIANRLISWVTGVRLHDYGCTLKAMRGDVARQLRLYGEMHRFIPALASWIGVRIVEVPVAHHPRRFGKTKYGISRTLRVVLDLIVVRFMQSYVARPMQVFGLAGLVLSAAGIGICAWLAFEKLVRGVGLANRPLLLLGILLVVVGVQLLSLGLVADVVSRTYYESQNKRPYYVRETIVGRGHRPEMQAASHAELAGGEPEDV